MRKIILFIIFFVSQFNYSQCSYTGTPLTQAGTDYTFCIDNSNTISTVTVRAGQYVAVNVVKGFSYTFSVGNVFGGGAAENLTILNATTNANVTPSAFSSGTNGTTLNWTASFSGKIKLLLSRGACLNDNTNGGALTLTLNSVGNTQDSQTAFGTDQWIGHVYNWTGSAPPGGFPSASTPPATGAFTNANYVGYYTIPSENISETFGGNFSCFPVQSNGTNLVNIYTEQYAVRYRMRSTKVGCYLISFNGDDGVRLYVDGVKLFDEWKEQSPTVYNNILIYLNGNSDIVFDYYENAVNNVASFSIAPFDPLTNSISNTDVRVCSGVSPGALNGSAYTYTGFVANPTLSYQWQVSSDNVTFTNISGATTEDYTPPTQTTATTNIIRYYRRVVTATAVNASGCSTVSNVAKVTTSPGTPARPAAITGTTTQCPTATGQQYSVTPVANALAYNWTVPTGWSITSGSGTNTITVTTGTTGQNGTISVRASNGCGTSASRTLAVTVSTNPVGGTANSNQTICSGTTPAAITLTGYTGTIQWQSSTDGTTFTPISGATAATLPGTTIGTLTSNRYIRALVTGGCASTTSTTVLITVTNLVSPGTISANQTICTGSIPADITILGQTGSVQWQSSTNGTTFTNISGATATTLPGATIGALTSNRFIRAQVNGACNSVTTNVILITVATPVVTGTIASNQSICSGTMPSDISISGQSGSIQWQISTDGSTFTPISGATGTTLAGVTIGVLTTNRYIRALVTGGCNSAVTNVVLITVSPLTVGGTVSSNQTICNGSTPQSLLVSGYTGSIIKWQKSTNPTFASAIDIAETSATLPGNAIGPITQVTYIRAVVQSGSCAQEFSSFATITLGSTSTWNGSSWDITPNGTTSLIFNGNYNSSADISGCSCTVNSGQVVINSGHDMNLVGSVTVNGGTLTFENTANLIQQQNVSNTGSIRFKRNSSALKRLDYTLWSSPVSGQNLLAFSPLTLTNRFYEFNPLTNLYAVVTPSTTSFQTGKGYLIRTPNNHPTWATVYAGLFQGVPNNGTITVPITEGGTATTRYNAIGNPYPSALKISEFLTANAANIQGTLWFWRKTNDDNNPVSYSTCTTVGCTVNNGHHYTDDTYISAGQGFLVEAKSGATQVVFTNAMRGSSNTNQFFRSTQNNTQLNEPDRFWLDLKDTNFVSYGKNLIAFDGNSTWSFDEGRDGLALNESPTGIYMKSTDKNVVIQALPEFNPTFEIPLSFKTNTAGTYYISLDQVNGIFNNEISVFLRDTETQNDIILTGTDYYAFTSQAGVFDNRFKIIFITSRYAQTEQMTAFVKVVNGNNEISFYSNEKMSEITLYDTSGRLLQITQEIEAFKTEIPCTLDQQIIIAKIKTTSGKILTQKIIR